MYGMLCPLSPCWMRSRVALRLDRRNPSLSARRQPILRHYHRTVRCGQDGFVAPDVFEHRGLHRGPCGHADLLVGVSEVLYPRIIGSRSDRIWPSRSLIHPPLHGWQTARTLWLATLATGHE